MKPYQLKTKYLENIAKLNIPKDLQGIREELEEFLVFKKERFNKSKLTNEDQEILFVLGLPSEYKTGIIFRDQYSKNQIGYSTAGGDPVHLKENGELVSYNHDNDMEEMFINSSIKLYLECAVALQENEEVDLREIDQNLKDKDPNYWYSERKLKGLG